MEGSEFAPGYKTMKSRMQGGRTDHIDGSNLNDGSRPETIYVTEIDNDKPFLEDSTKPVSPSMPKP